MHALLSLGNVIGPKLATEDRPLGRAPTSRFHNYCQSLPS